MKKLIDKNLYIRSLKELIYTAVIMTAIATVFLFMKNNGMSYELNIYYFRSVAYNPSDISLFFMMIFSSFALSNVSIWFARDKKKADYVYSLPYTKGQIYASKFAAVFTMQIASLIFIVLFGAILSIEIIGKIAFVGDMLLVLINAMIGSLVIVGAMFLSASVTGKALSTVLLSGFLAVLPAVPYISKTNAGLRTIDAFYTGMYTSNDSLYIIPNFFNSITSGINPGIASYRNILPIVVTLLLGAVYAGLGYYLFKKRSGELTGTHTKNKVLHMAVMGIIPMFIVYWLIVTTSIGRGIIPAELKNTLLFLMLSLMFAVLYEVIVNRTLKKGFRCLLVLICSVVLASAVHFSSAAVAKHSMEREIKYTDVESINFVNDTHFNSIYSSSGRMSYGEYMVSSIDITDEEAIKYALEKAELGYREANTDFSYSQLVRFNLKSGASVYKKIYLYVKHENSDEIKRDLDVIFEENPEFYDYINTVMPSEYTTFIFSEYQHDVINNQETMENIYESYINEYGELSADEKAEHREYGQNYAYGSEVLSNDDYTAPTIGMLSVSGRIGSQDIIDICRITMETEETANTYMQAANDRNFLNFSNIYYDNIDNDKVFSEALLLHIEYFYDENEVNTIFNMYRSGIQSNVIPLEQEYFLEALRILLSENITTPEVNEEFVRVVYFDYETMWQREVFLPISQNQIEQLVDLQEELRP